MERVKGLIGGSLTGLERVMVSDCLSLDAIDKIIHGICENEGDPIGHVVIEDLDEAFNVFAFKDYDRGKYIKSNQKNWTDTNTLNYTAGIIITKILRNLRKLAYRQDTWCFLCQCNATPNYSVRYVDKLVLETCDVDC